jgi:prevent-host-death family protein
MVLDKILKSHIVHIMETISIRDLHMHTGLWVRRAGAAVEPVVISDRGRPVARLMPLEAAGRTSFTDRVLVAGFEDLPPVDSDSGRILEEDRR